MPQPILSTEIAARREVGWENIPTWAGWYSYPRETMPWTWRCRWAKDAFAKRMIAFSGEAAWKRHRRGTILEAMLFFGLVVAGLGLVGVSLVKAARAALTLPVLLAGWALFIVFLLAYPRLSSRLKSPAAWEAERQAKLDLPAFVLRLTTLA